MDKLITIIPAADVTADYKKEAKTWGKWDSKSKKGFPYNYTADERVWILDGKAELTPTDGSDAIVIGKGMAVTFHKGFKCKWKMLKRMKKHYTVDVASDAPAIACDVCDVGCEEESYFMADGEQDICPKCYEKDKDTKYADAEHQKGGEKWVEEVPKPQKKKRKTKK